MAINLSDLFPSFRFVIEEPLSLPNDVYIYEDLSQKGWIVIDKHEVSTRDHKLLCSLFNYVTNDPFPLNNSEATHWMRYLAGTGPSLLHNSEEIRIIQLTFSTEGMDTASMKEVVQAFFGDEMILLHPSPHTAFLIEKKAYYTYSADEFSSFAAVLESDFFIKPRLYIGKFYTANVDLPIKFQKEKDLFSKAISRFPSERIFTMEKIFPSLLADSLSADLQATLQNEVLIPLLEEDELLKTVRYFFENGFNGSVTAEKLHIHRNTLNYRLTKFQEITGLSVRNFEGALVAYFASLLASKQ